MLNSNLKKWQNLLGQLDINLEGFTGLNLKYSKKISTLNDLDIQKISVELKLNFPKNAISTLRESELRQFEALASLVLPEKYKEYSQVFGSGQFGRNGFFIKCPSLYNYQAKLNSDKAILENCINDWTWNIQNKKILESAYLFGYRDDITFIFDLSTYEEQDRSCDIYGIASEEGLIYNLGRDFFNFICDICIERKFREKFSRLYLGIGEDELEDEDYEEVPGDSYESTVFFPTPVFEELE